MTQRHGNPWRIARRLAAGMLAAAAALVSLAAPAGAQFFDERYPFFRREPYYEPPPPRPPRGMPYFDRPFWRPYSRPQPQQPAESIKAPPPRKLDNPPANTIVVIGDEMADWLAYGLEERYADTPDIGIERKVRPASGLVRYDPKNDALDWAQAVKDALADEKPSAIVVMLGLNDRLPLRERVAPRPAAPPAGAAAGQAQTTPPKPGAPGAPAQAAPAAAQAPDKPEKEQAAEADAHAAAGPSYDFHTDKWAELYGKRVDEMIAVLKTKGVPVLWVGLPAIRGTRSTSDMGYMDEIYRAHAEKDGIIYVDIWDGFVDDQGRYSLQGPDFEGQTRRLRTYDGVHFTKAGAVKLASYVEHELRHAMANHVVPVALPEPEQAPAKPGSSRPAVGPVLPLTATRGSDENGGTLLGGGNGGAADAGAANGTDGPNRGDAQPPPPGRADNFAWPRPKASAAPAPAAEAAAPPSAPAAAGPAKKGAAETKGKGKGGRS